MMTDEYNHGIDNAAFYDLDLGTLTPWRGIISVEPEYEARTGVFTFDGEVIYQTSYNITNRFKISAFTYPEEFARLSGWIESGGNVMLGGAPSNLFNLIYRTIIGGKEAYYIHWAVSATPSDMNYNTITTEKSPVVFSWEATELLYKQLGEEHPIFGHSIYFTNEITSKKLDDLVNGRIPPWRLSNLTAFFDLIV